MSQVAIIRQRIKAIQTIQKTTSAMRLIAMSLQGRLRKIESLCTAYLEAIRRMKTLYHENQQKKVDESPHVPSPAKTLIVLIGSQKGLCGTFNEQLFAFFLQSHTLSAQDTIVTIGTYATRFIEQQGYKPLHALNLFSISTFTSIARTVTHLIMNAQVQQVIIYSQQSQNFFVQRPRATLYTITPRATAENSSDAQLNDYLSLLDMQAHILYLCYESLLAEQAARFLSMDSATRNAEDLLTRMKLEYNKTRQALVTRELIELSSGFVND